MKKKISIIIPCYNEEKNIMIVYDHLKKLFDQHNEYNYEILFSDNNSYDNSHEILVNLAKSDKHVKVIFNQRNFGALRNGLNGFFNSSGDAMIFVPCDMQDPPELITEFLKYWEQGYKVVLGKKVKSQENVIKYAVRSIYYKIIKFFSDSEQFEQTDGFGLYDSTVINLVKSFGDNQVSLRHVIGELGYSVKLIPYTQNKRKNGKSSYNFFSYYYYAMDSLVQTSTVPLKLASIIGVICSIISFIVGLFYLIYKILYWNSFNIGIAPIVISIFFLGSVQLSFIGILGAYIGSIYEKVTKRPLVVESERINFDD